MTIQEKMEEYAKTKIKITHLTEDLDEHKDDILFYVLKNGIQKTTLGSFFAKEEYEKKYSPETQKLLDQAEALKKVIKAAIEKDIENKKVKQTGKPKQSLVFKAI